MRPTRDTVLMDIARSVATRGTCPRKQVGAIIVRDFRVVSMGYNGAAPGMPQCDEVGCKQSWVDCPDHWDTDNTLQRNPKPILLEGCTRAIQIGRASWWVRL